MRREERLDLLEDGDRLVTVEVAVASAGGGSVAAAPSNGGGNGSTHQVAASTSASSAISVSPEIMEQTDEKLDRVREARMKGYEGDACGECGNFTLVRNGTCLKCNTCGGTSGCS